MATKLPTACSEPGCPAIVTSRWCETHRKAHRRRESDRRRSEGTHGNEMYAGKRWRKVRELYLKRQPLCERCRADGALTPADVVHHKRPIADGGARYSLDNLESLCHVHHNREHA